MKFKSFIFLVCACSGIYAIAQKKNTNIKKKIEHEGTAYLQGGAIGSGMVSKQMFDSLCYYPLVAKDSNGILRPVIKFSFIYAERGVYEDSTGKLRIMTDYYPAESEDGVLPEYWIKNMKERTKHGDTAIFNYIIANYEDTAKTNFYVAPLKLIITE